MELGVRDWMIIVGILLIAVVLFDGFRRMRNDRRGKIRMSLNKNFVNSSGDIDEPVNNEVLGGPRVVPRKQGEAVAKPQQADDDLQLDEDVPMLMESISASHYSDDDVLAGSEQQAAVADATDNSHADEQTVAASEPVQAELEPLSDQEQQELQQDPESEQYASQDYADQEVIVINVMAKGQPFKGADLLHILLACDCRFGEMNIFHRYENASGKGPIQFSIVNSVEPGTFDLDNIDQFSTPGVCFFVKVPGPKKPIQAFDYMVETAQCLVKNLNGELRDETHSVMTAQTLEHCRNRIREIERKQLTHA